MIIIIWVCTRCQISFDEYVREGFARWRVAHNRVYESPGGATVLQPTRVVNVSSCYQVLRRIDSKPAYNKRYFVLDFHSIDALNTVLRQVYATVIVFCRLSSIFGRTMKMYLINQSINQRRICRAPLYDTSRSASRIS